MDKFTAEKFSVGANWLRTDWLTDWLMLMGWPCDSLESLSYNSAVVGFKMCKKTAANWLSQHTLKLNIAKLLVLIFYFFQAKISALMVVVDQMKSSLLNVTFNRSQA